MSEATVKVKRPDWWQLSVPVGALLNRWADRNDLLAFLGPERGGETAFCDLLRGEIEANTDLLYKGYGVEDVVRHGVSNYRKFPIATGALYHEAMHARHTPRGDKSRVLSRIDDRREVFVLTMMEEPRIEYRGVQHDEKMQRYLRASGLRVALGERKDDDDRSPVDMMPITLGRVAAGVLKPKDVKRVRDAYVKHLTEDVVLRAEALMTEFIHLDDNDHEGMHRVVREWCAEIPSDVPEQEQDPENGDGDGAQGGGMTMDDLMDILEGAAAAAGSGAMEDLDEDERKERRAARDKERWEKEQRKRDAEKAKGKERRPQEMRGGGSYGASGSVPFRERKPTSEERAAAVRLSNILARVEYSDKVRHHVASEVPPGRPKMRTVIHNRGARAAGSRSKPLPEWELLRRETVDTPSLRVGMIVDVSGSMSEAMAPMAVTSYVLKTALDRIQAKTATVYMGGIAYPSKASKDAVQVWDACAGWENHIEAKAMLDSELNLTIEEDGARLAVIVSDGQYQHDQKESVREWMRLLRRQGASVLWLGYGSHRHAEAMCREVGADFIALTGRETPADVATIVGNAAVRVLREKKL